MDDDSAQWRRFLQESDASRMRDALVAVSIGRTVSLIDLLEGWGAHLAKFEADLAAAPGDRGVWGAHDFIAALIIRDRIVEGMDLLAPDLKPRAESVVERMDQGFMSFTEPDAEGHAERVDGRVDRNRGWWWRRLPKRGPVRDEMLLVYGSAVNE